jgi:hypothetical protein
MPATRYSPRLSPPCSGVEQQVELLLGEIDVDRGERESVKGEVPSGEPGIFPGFGSVAERKLCRRQLWTEFASDSPLEESGFEPLVPLATRATSITSF